MKIVIVSCATYQSSNEYSTMLTKVGFEQAEKLVSILKSLNPDLIYASPFVRTLQTIYPFCTQAKIKVKPECSLYPLERYDIKEYYAVNEMLVALPSYFQYLLDIVEDDYDTKLFHCNVSRNESSCNIGNRVFPFLYSLKKQYLESDKTILIVTHTDICPYFLQYFGISSCPEMMIDGSLNLIDLGSDINRLSHTHIAMSKHALS